MSARGFLLLEMIAAILVLALAMGGMAAGFLQILQCQKKIETQYKRQDAFRILFLRLEKDARSAVSLREYPFRGKKEEISFPLIQKEGEVSKLILVRYFLKDHALMRSAQELRPGLSRAETIEKKVASEILELEFQFPYLVKEEEDVSYESSWPEKPYFGIPRAIRLTISPAGSEDSFSKLLSLPQGRWGHEAFS